MWERPARCYGFKGEQGEHSQLRPHHPGDISKAESLSEGAEREKPRLFEHRVRVATHIPLAHVPHYILSSLRKSVSLAFAFSAFAAVMFCGSLA